MKVEELKNITADELVRRIQASAALEVFARRRAKFEGWLKVELIDILIKNGYKDALPEQGLIDVSFGKVAIELKIVNTNYRDGLADIKGKPITKNISSVIADIAKHRKNEFPHKFLIFVVFPLTEEHDKWKKHLARVENELGDVCTSYPFTFTKISEGSQGVCGILYCGKIK